jgi:predicted enzyme related to lactoylglutathione lyase
MRSSVFCRYDLRTIDPDAARIFYAEVAGLDFSEKASADEAAKIAVWPLHEQARARGAPPHWLGQIGVPELEPVVTRLVAHGSERLGPTVRTHDGTEYATVRDPLGAVVAVRADMRRPRHRPVVWHQLHTRDLDRSWGLYTELFGWTPAGSIEVADPEGGHRLFTWEGAVKSVGSIANTARTPGIHPHWLFYFPVTDIDAAMTKVRAHGGNTPPAAIVLPTGERIAPCEDGQGAAFGLHQAAPEP